MNRRVHCWICGAEPINPVVDSGDMYNTATALAVAACPQRRRVRFATAAELVNELNEARQKNEVSRVVNRWTRYELILLDEMCYVARQMRPPNCCFRWSPGERNERQ